MTTNPEIMERVYWLHDKSWYTHEEGMGDEGYRIKEDAPERAKKSFEEWLKHKDE